MLILPSQKPCQMGHKPIEQLILKERNRVDGRTNLNSKCKRGFFTLKPEQPNRVSSCFSSKFFLTKIQETS